MLQGESCQLYLPATVFPWGTSLEVHSTDCSDGPGRVGLDSMMSQPHTSHTNTIVRVYTIILLTLSHINSLLTPPADTPFPCTQLSHADTHKSSAPGQSCLPRNGTAPVPLSRKKVLRGNYRAGV